MHAMRHPVCLLLREYPGGDALDSFTLQSIVSVIRKGATRVSLDEASFESNQFAPRSSFELAFFGCFCCVCRSVWWRSGQVHQGFRGRSIRWPHRPPTECRGWFRRARQAAWRLSATMQCRHSSTPQDLVLGVCLAGWAAFVV